MGASTIHEPDAHRQGTTTRSDEPLDRYMPCVSAAMQELAASVARVAATDAPVLICGEAGTGKSTLAQQLYEDSPRRVAPLIIMHGATTTPGMINGLAQFPQQTVLFEEVGELAPTAQDSLVRLMAAATSLRFIATTSHDVSALMRRHVLRPDLLYRLDVVRLDIPPLRQRPEDVVFLAEHFLTLAARYFQRPVHFLTPDARARLLLHPWTGNVRELRNCMLESVLHCPRSMLRAADLRLRTAPAAFDPQAELSAVLARLQATHPAEFYAHMQRLVLQWALLTCDGNRLRTAALLGIGRGSLRAKLRRYGLDDAGSGKG